jgi:hypothetical protein
MTLLVSTVSFSQVAYLSHKQLGKEYNAKIKAYEIKAQDSIKAYVIIEKGKVSISKNESEFYVFDILTKPETIKQKDGQMMYVTVRNSQGLELLFCLKFNLAGNIIYSAALMTPDVDKVIIYSNIENVTENYKKKSLFNKN